jgi:peptidoglycan/LPS O-acetylase OafA/YrhL
VAPGRVHSYDLYRGLLLASMVVYHVLLNLTPLHLNVSYFYWIPMGFVLFLGVVLARFLQNQTHKKLLLALKVLGAFAVLNIPNYFKPEFTLLALVRGSELVLSFEILLPMALVILLSIPLDRLRRFGYLLAGVTLVAIAAVNLAGFYSYNLQFVLYGLVGYFLALKADLATIARTRNPWFTVVAALVCCIPFVLLRLGYYFDFVFVFGVLALYYIVAQWIRSSRPFEFVGRHSFVIYIAHIVVIKVIVEALARGGIRIK